MGNARKRSGRGQRSDKVATLQATVDEQAARIEELEEKIRLLEQRIADLHELAFGPRTEKSRRLLEEDLVHQTGMLPFRELSELKKELAELKATRASVEVKAHQRQRHGRRKEFPEHLPRKHSVLELSEAGQQCGCGRRMKEIGSEITQELERIEQTYVHVIERKKFACSHCKEGVRMPVLTGRPIEKGILGPGFIAHMLQERFGNHMPYYRLEQKYKSEGLPLSRSVLCETAMQCAELFEPAYRALKKEVLSSYVVQSDDTKVTQRNGTEPGRNTGRIWGYRAQEGGVFFEFRKDRSRDGPIEVLGNREGYVQADAYSGYDELFQRSSCVEVGCWAHARRYYVKARETEPEKSRQMLRMIRELYAIERQIKDDQLDAEGRLRLRQERSKEVLHRIRTFLEVTVAEVLPKSPMARAVGYVLNQWKPLTRFLEDGRILEIDNDGCERTLRPWP